MKKIVVFTLLFFVIAAFTGSSANAAGLELDNYPTFYDSDEYAEIQDVLLSSEIIKANSILGIPSDLSRIVSSYKVYHSSLSTSVEFIDQLAQEGALTLLNNGDYHWMVITKDNAAIRVISDAGLWKVVGYRDPVKGLKVSQDIHQEVVEKALEGIQVQSLQAIEVSQIYLTVLCVQATDGSSYVIPFASRPDFTHLENGKLYTPEEMGRILKSSDYYLNPPQGDQNGSVNGGMNNGSPITPDPSVPSSSDTPILPFLLGGGAILILVVVSVVFYKKKQ